VAIILDHESTTDSPGHHACRFFRKIIAGQLFHQMRSKLLGTPSGSASKYESGRVYLGRERSREKKEYLIGEEYETKPLT